MKNRKKKKLLVPILSLSAYPWARLEWSHCPEFYPVAVSEACAAAAAAAKSLQSCPTPWTPWTAAHQAPPSLGFSRQEHWAGLPLPFPVVLNVLKQNKQTHSVTLSLPLNSVVLATCQVRFPHTLVIYLHHFL